VRRAALFSGCGRPPRRTLFSSPYAAPTKTDELATRQSIGQVNKRLSIIAAPQKPVRTHAIQLRQFSSAFRLGTSDLPSLAQKDATLWLTNPWLTNPDRSALLAEQSSKLAFSKEAPTGQVIDVDSAKTYQAIDGFGFALTGGSAMLIHHMDPARRRAPP
jgi:hypothetical protein